MARTKRIKETAAGVANYHVIARTNNKVFLFDSPKTKDALVDVLKRSAAFSGVEIGFSTHGWRLANRLGMSEPARSGKQKAIIIIAA